MTLRHGFEPLPLGFVLWDGLNNLSKLQCLILCTERTLIIELLGESHELTEMNMLSTAA